MPNTIASQGYCHSEKQTKQNKTNKKNISSDGVEGKGCADSLS